LEVLILADGGRLLGLGRRLGFRFRLVQRNRLSRLSAAGRRTSGLQFLVQLRHPLAQVGVLLDEAGEFDLDQIEKRVDLILVITALSYRRLTERDIVYVGWCERHSMPPWSLDRQPISKCRASSAGNWRPSCHTRPGGCRGGRLLRAYFNLLSDIPVLLANSAAPPRR